MENNKIIIEKLIKKINLLENKVNFLMKEESLHNKVQPVKKRKKTKN